MYFRTNINIFLFIHVSDWSQKWMSASKFYYYKTDTDSDQGRSLVLKENDSPSFEAAGSSALQRALTVDVLRRTCRIILWWTGKVRGAVAASGCT